MTKEEIVIHLKKTASFYPAIGPACLQAATLIEGQAKGIEELKQERVAIDTALDREFCFPGDKRSGDLLDDLACFIDHHKAKEEQLLTLRTQNEKLVRFITDFRCTINAWMDERPVGKPLDLLDQEAKALLAEHGNL